MPKFVRIDSLCELNIILFSWSLSFVLLLHFILESPLFLSILNRFSFQGFIFILKSHVVKLQFLQCFLLLLAFPIALAHLLIMLGIALIKTAILEMLLPCGILIVSAHTLMMPDLLTDVHISLDTCLDGGICEIFSRDTFTLS